MNYINFIGEFKPIFFLIDIYALELISTEIVLDKGPTIKTKGLLLMWL